MFKESDIFLVIVATLDSKVESMRMHQPAGFPWAQSNLAQFYSHEGYKRFVKDNDTPPDVLIPWTYIRRIERIEERVSSARSNA